MKAKALIYTFAGLASLGFSSKAPSKNKIWVAVYDGSKQCEKKVVDDSKFRLKLESASIQIFEFEKKHDGKMRTAVCGNDTGMMSAFLISDADAPKALELGFEKL